MKRYSKDTEARPGPLSKGVFLTQRLKKWQNELDKEFQAMSWLDCEVSGGKNNKTCLRGL